MSNAHPPTEFVRALARRFADDARVEGLWLEGEDDSIQWPPYPTLDIHLAVPEPSVDPIRQELLGIVAELDPGASELSQQEAPLKGFAGTGRLGDGTPFSYRIERTSQVGKLPRRAVNLLLDRSNGMLLPGMSFE